MNKVFAILLLFVGSLFAFEELTENNFKDKIANKNVIIDFYATW